MNFRAAVLLVLSIASFASLLPTQTGCGSCNYLGPDLSRAFRCFKEDKPADQGPSQPQVVCPDSDDTSILNGIQNDFQTTLTKSNDFNSQVHFKTAGEHFGFHRLTWVAALSRQTCTGGNVHSQGFNSYMNITMSPGTSKMRVVPGKNYFDYQAWGCRTAEETTCGELVEEGTAILDVTYVP